MQLQFRGPIIRGKTAFTFTVSGTDRYTSNNLIAVDRNNNRIGEEVQVPTDQRNVNAGIEHALTKNSTLRLSYQRSQSEASYQGLSSFDLPQRARTTESAGNLFRAQVQGIVGKASLNELRFQLNRNTSNVSSLTPGGTIIIQDAANFGGAGVTSNNLSQTFELADNFDFTPHRNHQMRVGSAARRRQLRVLRPDESGWPDHLCELGRLRHRPQAADVTPRRHSRDIVQSVPVRLLPAGRNQGQ